MMHGLETIIKLNETKTITVTIGRNIGSSPMDAKQWWNFQHSIIKLAEIGKVNFAGSSNNGNESTIDVNKWSFRRWRRKSEEGGRWKGITEDNFNVVFSLVVGEIPRLKRKLTALKETHKQESIALTIGSTELI